jgi:hypothetical protein
MVDVMDAQILGQDYRGHWGVQAFSQGHIRGGGQ